jgi:hypothetical protein
LVRSLGLGPTEFCGSPWNLPTRFLLAEMLPFSWRRALREGSARRQIRFLADGDGCETRGRRFAIPASAPVELVLATWHEIFAPYPPNGHCYWSESCSVQANDVVFDIGASEGFFAQLALEARAKTVVCFEPSEEWCESLRCTFSRELANNQVVTECTRVGLAAETALSQSLDDLVFGGSLPKPTFLKIDVEGDELEVLQSARRILGELRPRVAIATYHTSTEADQCRTFLRACCPSGATDSERLSVRCAQARALGDDRC